MKHPISIPLILGCISCGIYGCGRTAPSPHHPDPSSNQQHVDACQVQQVTIEQPDTSTTEEASLTVSGSLDDACAAAWLVVHPLGGANYYVQPKLAVSDDGRWVAEVPLGEAGQTAEKTFEIMAFAGAEADLGAGDVLTAWPEAEARSEVVTITRKAVAPPAPETTTPPLSPDCKLTIIEPTDGEKVSARQTVKVQAHESCKLSAVWLVVHPTEISTYYVQPRLSEKAGVWKVDAYFGEPGRNKGAIFEAKAFGSPTESLHEGDELPYWPEAAVASEYVEFKRR
jgi:hypothetical protein